MPYIAGTATDYQDCLDQLIDIVTGDGVTAAAIVGGGTGYTVEDILTVVGGTSTHVATLRVTSVSSGVIDGIKVEEAGSYTVDPTNAVSVTGGTGGDDATFNLTLVSNGWTIERENPRFDNFVISAGGSGYAANDEVTISGGTFTKAAVIEVLTVSSGAIVTFQVIEEGIYTVLPASPASTTTTGSGTGATFTFAEEKELILNGAGNATDDIIVGVRTYDNLNVDAQNWELSGMTGFEAASSYVDQPGKTDGGLNTALSNQGAYVSLDDASFPFWFFVDSFRITGVMFVDNTSYESFYLGFLSAYSTETNNTYPMFICGSQATKSKYNSNRISHSSIADPRTRSTSGTGADPQGPGWTYVPGTGFVLAYNAYELSSSESTIGLTSQPPTVVWPTGMQFLSSGTSGYGNGSIFEVEARGVSYTSLHMTEDYKSPIDETPNFPIVPTPNSGGDLTQVWNCMSYNLLGFYGELQGVFWFSGTANGASAQDEIVIGTDRYLVFLAGTRTGDTAFWCIKKE